MRSPQSYDGKQYRILHQVLISQYPQSIIVFQRNKNKIDKKNKDLWYTLQVNFKNLDGDEFENLLWELYKRKGFDVTKSKKGADDGIDLMVRKGNTTIVVQAKNWKGKVSNGDILKTAGARQMYNAKYALVIISSHFTSSAKKVIYNTPGIRGMEVEGLKRQIRKNFQKEIKKPRKESLLDKINSKVTGKKNQSSPKIVIKPKEEKIEPIKPNSKTPRRKTPRHKTPRHKTRNYRRHRKS